MHQRYCQPNDVSMRVLTEETFGEYLTIVQGKVSIGEPADDSDPATLTIYVSPQTTNQGVQLYCFPISIHSRWLFKRLFKGRKGDALLARFLDDSANGSFDIVSSVSPQRCFQYSRQWRIASIYSCGSCGRMDAARL